MKRKCRFIFLIVLSFLLRFSCVDANPIYYEKKIIDYSGNPSLWMILVLMIGVIFILQIAARALMLEKCGESGGKILIPFYGRYIEYKTYWKPKYFWINFGISIYLIAAVPVVNNSENRTYIGILAVLFLAAIGIYLINVFRLRMNILKKFGRSRKLAFLGLLGLGFILDFICGFPRRERKEESKTEDVHILQDHIDNWE